MRLYRSLPHNISSVGRRTVGALAVLLFAVMALPQSAMGVPSFARQTGLACSQCHVYAFGPALTPFGRQFKLNGYTMRGEDTHPMPLALMLQGGYSRTAAAQPDVPVAMHFDELLEALLRVVEQIRA